MIILLLKERRHPDTYAEAFQHSQQQHDATTELVYLPVLQPTTLDTAHEDVTRSLFPYQSSTRHSCVICTSRRSSEIVAHVLSSRTTQQQNEVITALPCFAVGPSTATPLREAGQQVFGEDAGTAANLAALVIEHYTLAVENAPQIQSPPPYVFVCGESRRNTLPLALAEQSVPFIEIIAYRTEAMSSLSWPDAAPDWMVFFSPAGVRAAFSVEPPSGWDLRGVRHAAIGPTTAACLSEEFGVSVNVVATKPTARNLANEMLQWEREEEGKEEGKGKGKGERERTESFE